MNEERVCLKIFERSQVLFRILIKLQELYHVQTGIKLDCPYQSGLSLVGVSAKSVAVKLEGVVCSKLSNFSVLLRPILSCRKTWASLKGNL